MQRTTQVVTLSNCPCSFYIDFYTVCVTFISHRSSGQEKRVKPHEERKFIVFERQLFSLLSFCPICAGPAEASILKEIGTMVKIQYWCTDEKCKFTDVWFSQPFANGKMPVGNLLSSSILLMGKCLDSYISVQVTRYI